MPDLRLLIVDDDPLLLEMMVNIASMDAKLAIETANNGVKAVELIQNSPRYDMILTDLVMPDLSGIEVLKFARAKSEHTLVALVTGFGNLEEAVNAIRLGAFGYVHKPFRAEELLLTIRNMRMVLGYRLENADLKNQCRGLQARMTSLDQRIGRLVHENAALRHRLAPSTRASKK